MNRPTMNGIAESLGVSRVTVWKALNNKPGVSPELRDRIKQRCEQLWTEDKPDDNSGTHHNNRALYNVSLVVSRAYSSVFWTKIINQIAADLGKKHINLVYNPVDTVSASHHLNTGFFNILNNGHARGMIVINVYDKVILQELARLAVPKVFLDSVPSMSVNDLGGDVVLLEGIKTTTDLTRQVLSNGARSVAFVGDIEYARTNQLRWIGFNNALAEAGLHPEARLCLTGPLGQTSHEAEIADFIAGIERLPDAIICVNDYVANIVVNTLKTLRPSQAAAVTVTGYDDSPEFFTGKPTITTVHVQNELVGSRLVSQLLFRIDHPGADFEEITIFPKIRYRG